MKNGEGRFLHLDKGQVYTGTWVEDVARCGIMEDVNRDSALNPPPYPIPQVHTHTHTHTPRSNYIHVSPTCSVLWKMQMQFYKMQKINLFHFVR